MNTIKSLLLVLALFILIGHVGATTTGDKGKNAFSKKIQSALSAPKGIKPKSGPEKITVCFVVNEQGTVTEACAKTANPEVRQNLQKQFMGMNLQGLAPCVTHSIDVNFVNY